MATEAFQAARETTEPHWIAGASHVGRYDKEEHVAPAVARLNAFFTASLTGIDAPA